MAFQSMTCIHAPKLKYHKIIVELSLCRADREKSILQGKLRMVQKNIIESTGRPQLVGSIGKEATPTSSSADGAGLGGEERHRLKSRIYQLENEVATCTCTCILYLFVWGLPPPPPSLNFGTRQY